MTTQLEPTVLDLARRVATDIGPTDSNGRIARMFARALIEVEKSRADRALEAVLEWARASRESDRRGTELHKVRQAAQRERFSAPAQDQEQIRIEGQIRADAENALHDACVREDRAEEGLKEIARALLEEELAADAKTNERHQELADVADSMRGTNR